MTSPWPRLQLFEFNDLAGLHPATRDTVVESLSRTLEWGGMLDGLARPFARFLDEAGTREVLDLGSGAGGPARILSRALTREGLSARFVLTDLHPRVEAWTAARARHPEAVHFEPRPVDATRVPTPLARGRARCLINVLHHFPPAVAAAVLEDAVRGSRGVFVAECFERHPSKLASFAIAGIPALLANPLLSERHRLRKAILTYLSPAAIAMAVWDGLVSTLRVYEEDELRAMIAPFGMSFRWTWGRFGFFPRGTGYYFWGVPVDARDGSAPPGP